MSTRAVLQRLIGWFSGRGGWQPGLPGRSALMLFVGGLLLVSACGQRTGEPPAAGNLLQGKAPVAASAVSGTATLSDGIAALPGDDWETDLVAQFEGTEAFVTYDLGAVLSLRAVWLQADHNDEYRVMISEDGKVFEQVWDSPSVRVSGMQDRFRSGLNATGRYLRLEPLRGDGRYGVSELQAFTEAPAAFPLEVPRRRGASLELMVRTKVLCFAGAAILFLLLAFQGAPWWWIALCAVLPLWTGLDAVLAVIRAWPVDDRQVSLVRSAMAAIAAAAIAREVFSPARIKAQRWAVFSCLGIAGAVAVLAFYNLGRPQFWDHRAQAPTPVHLLDLRQYYGTAKYFDELGYRDMYLADVAAYVEVTPGATLDNLRDTPMRDLTSHRMTTVGAEREKIALIKQRFTPERWESYKQDTLYFRDVMGKRDYLRYMFDYGGNATPVWISIAHFLFSTLDASTTTFLLTGLLDPLLFLVTFAAIGRCFGYRTMFVVMTVFGANDFIMYGSNWGGATLRHDWLMYIGLAACALKRERWALGGVFLALATVIRAFPAIVLVTATFPALWWVFDFYRVDRRWPTLREVYAAQRPIARVLVSAAVTIAVLVVATSLRWSPAAWGDWLSKVARLSADSHANSIALRGLIAGWEMGHHQLLRARWPLYAAGIAFYVLGVLLTCRQKSLERAAIWGLVLIPVVFYAANYYLHIVCLLPLIAVERRTRQQVAEPPVSVSDAWVWLSLLGLCVAQYYTVLVTDLALHFHLATVLLFGALTLILIVQIRADLREGRLDFLARFLGGDARRDANGTRREAATVNT